MRVFSTTLELINNSVRAGGWPAGQIIETNGFTVSGDTGGGRWAATGNVIAPSQTPLALNDIRLSDASGNEFELVHTGIIDLNVLGGVGASYIAIAVANGLTYSQAFTSVNGTDLINIDTVSSLEAYPSPSVGQSAVVAERANGIFDAVLTSGVSPNGRDVIQSTDDPLISWVLRVNELPFISALGASGAKTNTENATIMQYAIDTYGGFYLDVDLTYDVAIDLPSGGAKIYNVGSRKVLTWAGTAGTYGFYTSDTGGSYRNDLRGFEIQGSTNTRNGIDLYRIRFSNFEDIRIRFCNIAMRSYSTWNNRFVRCAFRNENNDAGSIGVYFEFDAAETFQINNATVYERCLFNKNENGIVLESAGDGLQFSNCGFEGNSEYGIVVQGQGVCHSCTFNNGCYIEANTLGNILWNKTGSGNYYGFTFQDCYFAMTSTARAGVIEFQGSNGASHSLVFKNLSFRDFSGTPTTNNLLDVNGATMSNIYIEWTNNQGGSALGSGVAAFDKDQVDWRYLKTDVPLVLGYITNVTSGNDWQAQYTGGEIIVTTPNFGMAQVQGSFIDSTNASGAAINITEQMPTTLRPQGLIKFPAYEGAGSSSAGTLVTVMIESGRIRGHGLSANGVSFCFNYNLSGSRVNQITI